MSLIIRGINNTF